MQKIILTTPDNLKLSALFWNREAFASVLLLHMMPAKKESWVSLGDKLATAGFNVLALDFRGHGESEGGDYQTFTDRQHQEYYLDVQTGAAYLEQSFPHTEVYLGGASIGANLTVKYLSEHRDTRKGFALSAGLDYYGVKAIDDIQNLDPGQKLLLVAARDDMRKSDSDCGSMAEQLFERATSQKERIVYNTGGHGTDMFNEHPELQQKIIEFLTT
jgi:alpha-beta hydrolase superfamily lysophospholipase